MGKYYRDFFGTGLTIFNGGHERTQNVVLLSVQNATINSGTVTALAFHRDRPGIGLYLTEVSPDVHDLVEICAFAQHVTESLPYLRDHDGTPTNGESRQT